MSIPINGPQDFKPPQPIQKTNPVEHKLEVKSEKTGEVLNITISLPQNTTDSPRYKKLKEIRDWTLATWTLMTGIIFSIWGLQGLYDRNFGHNRPDIQNAVQEKNKKELDDGLKSINDELKSIRKLLEEKKNK